MRTLSFIIGLLAVAYLVSTPANANQLDASQPTARDLAVPRYTHIFIIVEENKNDAQIIGSLNAPVITGLAHAYGEATDFFAETHPSEPNYVALVGGYTYGLRDDDAFYCKPDDLRPGCAGSRKSGFVDHTISAPNLSTQLHDAGLTWKNYNESIPKAGSLAVSTPLYASKHSGFINFANVQRDPHRAQHLVGFQPFYADLRDGEVPNFSLIIPNICDDMHGSNIRTLPADCRYEPVAPLVRRGDRHVMAIVEAIMASRVWLEKSNDAIVITWDEDDGGSRAGCCGSDPADFSNRGGGHVATIVITNHGPRRVRDATPYNHYSLLRTIDDAFGIYHYLERANAPGVVPMLPLFHVR
ncbi:MAG TPA: alkaline phosphatase family protein [Candidatus Baltobacteraceae bacterium]